MPKIINIFGLLTGFALLMPSCSMDNNKSDRRAQNSSQSTKKSSKAPKDAGEDVEIEQKNSAPHAQRSCENDPEQVPSFESNAASDQECTATINDGNSQASNGEQDKPIEAKVELETFKPYVEPEEKKLCHDKGFPFKREHSEEYQYGRCDERASWPAPFECNFAGVLKAFNNNSKLKLELETLASQQWYFDDCGVINGKPIVFFACYRSGGANCVKIEEIRVGEVTISGKSLSL